MKKLFLFGIFSVFSILIASDGVEKYINVNDFRKIDKDRFCAGVGFIKTENSLEDAGFILFNVANGNININRMSTEENENITSNINKCIATSDNIFLIQSTTLFSNTSDAKTLTIHKASMDGEIFLTKDIDIENAVIYPCEISIDNNSVVLDVVVEKKVSKNNQTQSITFAKERLIFDEDLQFGKQYSIDVDSNEAFACSKSKDLNYYKMFKFLIK